MGDSELKRPESGAGSQISPLNKNGGRGGILVLEDFEKEFDRNAAMNGEHHRDDDENDEDQSLSRMESSDLGSPFGLDELHYEPKMSEYHGLHQESAPIDHAKASDELKGDDGADGKVDADTEEKNTMPVTKPQATMKADDSTYLDVASVEVMATLRYRDDPKYAHMKWIIFPDDPLKETWDLLLSAYIR